MSKTKQREGTPRRNLAAEQKPGTVEMGKTWLLLLLAVVLLITGAVFPRIAAMLQDRMAEKRYGYSTMQSVNLEVISQKEQSVPTIAKLASLCSMEIMPISSSQAVMTEETVLMAVESAMADYEEAGLFQPFSYTGNSIQPCIGFRLWDGEQTTTFFVFWSVTYYNEEEPYQNLSLYIDDETGKILRIVYDSDTVGPVGGTGEGNQQRMEAFTEIYFRQLDLADYASYARTVGAGYGYWERDGGFSCARYSLVDEQYGRITLEFYVNEGGSLMVIFPI